MGIFTKNAKTEQDVAFDIERTKELIKNQKVNHILHLLLSILTGGLWLIVWILISISASMEKKRLEKVLKKLYNEKEIFVQKSNSAKVNTSSTNESTASQLETLSTLLKNGILTQEEFNIQKTKILNS